MMLGVSLSVSLAGCGMKITGECDWAEPILPSRSDVLSLETRRQIVAHNEIGARLCGWQP
jgi:hypothetical protein